MREVTQRKREGNEVKTRAITFVKSVMFEKVSHSHILCFYGHILHT